MLKRSASITLGGVVLIIILAGWWGHSRHDKSEFGGSGLGHGHGRALLGAGSQLGESDDLHGFEPEHFSTHEGLGGGYSVSAWWYTDFGGYPWWYWWQTNPIYANSLVARYPGYCDWCAYYDSLDPDGSTPVAK